MRLAGEFRRKFNRNFVVTLLMDVLFVDTQRRKITRACRLELLLNIFSAILSPVTGSKRGIIYNSSIVERFRWLLSQFDMIVVACVALLMLV